MKSIIMTYPDFQTLPKGIKMMLVASESFFFNQDNARLNQTSPAKLTVRVTLKPNRAPELSEHYPVFNSAWKN